MMKKFDKEIEAMTDIIKKNSFEIDYLKNKVDDVIEMVNTLINENKKLKNMIKNKNKETIKEILNDKNDINENKDKEENLYINKLLNNMEVKVKKMNKEIKPRIEIEKSITKAAENHVKEKKEENNIKKKNVNKEEEVITLEEKNVRIKYEMNKMR